MRGQDFRFVGVVAAVAVVVSIGGVRVAGQSAAAKRAMAGGMPRTADGHPDLQGTYDLGTLTPIERAAGSPLVLSDEDAKKREGQMAQRNNALNAAIDGNRSAPPKGGDGAPGPPRNVGGYTNFWLDPGSRYTVLDGQRRASLLIDPPDGRVPALTEAAQKRRAADAYARPTSDQSAREEDPGFEGPEAYND